MAEEAEAAGCDAVVAYHPPIFDAVKRLTAGSVVFDAIRRGVAIYSPHTALDVVDGGTNDMLADALGLTEREPLRLLASADGGGIGRIGVLPTASTRAELITRVKSELGVGAVLVAGPLDGVLTRAAVCAGAGRGLLDDAIKQKADLFLTGELPHHDALKAAAAGMTVVCVLHSNSERAALRRLKARIEEAAEGVDVVLSEVDRDPYTVS